MIYQATHLTHYKYEEPVSQCVSEARLAPRNLPWQHVLETKLEVHPEPALIERRKDYFGNDVATFTVFRTHDHFTAAATSIVEVKPRATAYLPQISWEQAQKALVEHPGEDSLEAYEFTFDSPFVASSPALADYARPSFKPGRPLAEAVMELSHRVNTEFLYRPKSTSIDTPLQEVLEKRQGVCQDFSHIMIGALRSLHLAARYVSGYLRSGVDVQGAEASHAWVSVFIPGYGWLPLDPTNDVIPSEGHITLAWGRDYGDVAPVKGISLGGGKQTVEVEVRVVPVQVV